MARHHPIHLMLSIRILWLGFFRAAESRTNLHFPGPSTGVNEACRNVPCSAGRASRLHNAHGLRNILLRATFIHCIQCEHPDSELGTWMGTCDTFPKRTSGTRPLLLSYEWTVRLADPSQLWRRANGHFCVGGTVSSLARGAFVTSSSLWNHRGGSSSSKKW